MNTIDADVDCRNAENDAACSFLNYFLCPSAFGRFHVVNHGPTSKGFFQFGSAVCFGKTDALGCAAAPSNALFNALSAVEVSSDGEVVLPFNPTEVVENLRLERYLVSTSSERLLHTLYYLVRPILPFPVRKLVQRSVSRRRLAGSFPAWPIDCSVEQILELLMQLAIRAAGVYEVPFIWFWPEGKHAAIMVTHDVEQQSGADLCDMLMDMDHALGIKAAFQVIPEGRYKDVDNLIANIRARGFEVNIHDLDHNGRLYEHEELFRQRAHKINDYGSKYRTEGFRAGSMHRKQDWFDLLNFQYEMSVPTVSHVEPQRGGCCTVMPYFVGNLLELPLTTVQDHSLFYILGERSIDLWKQQIDAIASCYGLLSFIVHPDYLVKKTERRIYRDLLEYLSRMRREENMWLAFPAEINDWWRKRSRMRLENDKGHWRVRGEGSNCARVAYASVVHGQLKYRIAE